MRAPVIVTPTSVVAQVWDADMNRRGWIDPDIITKMSGLLDSRTFTVPMDDKVARWLFNEETRDAYLTIDGPDGRWSGRLDRWQVDRVGPCEHCAHCMQKQLTAVWAA